MTSLGVDTTQKVLVAVSGGIDSMVLAHLTRASGMVIGIAHVDHGTRKGESGLDRIFVKKYTEGLSVPLHIHQIDADSIKGNFHQVTRNIRYTFFHSLDYDYILTGHHYEDQVETVLMNVLSGRSLEGIPEKNGKVLRPLIEFTKEEIKSYAITHDIAYREDSSNLKNDYFRNFLRHNIIPLLVEQDPQVKQKVIGLSQKVTQDLLLLDSLTVLTDSEETISLDSITDQGPVHLYHTIKKYGFTRSQAHDCHSSLHKKGLRYLSPTHLIVTGDKYIRIEKIGAFQDEDPNSCLLYTSPSPRDQRGSRMPSSA